jgi:HlyD family secretion protein
VDHKIQAQITKIDPVAVETRSALGLKERRVRVTLAPEKGAELQVIAGADVDVTFTAYQSEGVFTVPKSAVFPTQDGDGLWLIRDGKVVLQNIEIGYEARRFVEVLSGVEEGDYILKTYDAEGVEEGRKVKPANL